MFFSLFDRSQGGLASLLGQSALVTSGHGMSHGHHQPLEIGIAGLLGALCGFLAGLILARLARFVAYAIGRDLKSGKWAVYGAVLGGIIGAIWERFGD